MEKSIRKEIIIWNNRFPIDHWWRKKYNIAFGSFDHRKSNFLDQYFEYIEDEMFEELRNKKEYKANTGDWLHIRYSSKEDSLERLIEEGREEMKNFSL